MIISRQQKGDVWIISLVGVLDEMSELVGEGGELLDSGASKIAVDLSGVSMITSAGLSQLVQLTARANTQQSAFVLSGPTPFVRGVFETTRLIKFFEVHDDMDAALSTLSNRTRP